MMKLSFIKSKAVAAVVFMAAAFCVYSQVSFENPDLNMENGLLFSVKHKTSGSPSYSTAFMADASTLSDVKILTCYPEKMELLSKGAVLQLRNRYGTARYSVYDGTLSWITRTDSIPVLSDRQAPQSVSPDGKWIVYIKKTSAAEGELVLKNGSTLQETVLNKKVDFSFEKVPVLWNQESTSFLYEKNGIVYFCDPKAAFQKIQLTEEFRKIGKGSINSVCWANARTLIYIDRDLVYKISSNELYTRGLYSNMVGTGTVCGRLPVSFNADRDIFSVNPRGNSLVLIQGNRIVSLYKILDEGFEYLVPVLSKPVTDAAGTVIDIKPFWSVDSKCYLWVNSLGFEDGIQKSSVYTLGGDFRFVAMMAQAGEPEISPDGRRICWSQGKSLFVYEIAGWKLLDRLTGESLVSYLWNGNNSIFAGGTATVREWTPGSEEGRGFVKTLFLSSSDKVFWNEKLICAMSVDEEGKIFNYDTVKGVWKYSLNESQIPEGSVQNGRYRVFAGTTPNQKFANTLFVRTLSGKAVTRPLFPDSAVKSAPLKKVSVIVDVTDDAMGLSRILSVLKKYDVPATFFINGEFVRRYPKECRQIVKSGFDCGSMFFTAADLTDKGTFVMNEEFIRRGLARNEDEFFAATGKELSLFWHAPYFMSNENIRKFGQACGYRYVEAGRYALDTLTLEDAASGKPGYLSASQIISFFAENVRDGDIIPVSAGISNGNRTDYLYEKIDLLLGTLVNEGFEIVDSKNL